MHTWVKSALAATAAGAAVVAVAIPASAQEVIVEDGAVLVDEGPVIDGPVIVEGAIVEDVLPAPEVPAPRVYGWTARSGDDCGMYGYWNGVRCADARDEPPPIR